MTADNVVPFERKVTPVVWSDGTVQKGCSDLVHLFESVPGRCQRDDIHDSPGGLR